MFFMVLQPKPEQLFYAFVQHPVQRDIMHYGAVEHIQYTHAPCSKIVGHIFPTLINGEKCFMM